MKLKMWNLKKKNMIKKFKNAKIKIKIIKLLK